MISKLCWLGIAAWLFSNEIRAIASEVKRAPTQAAPSDGRQDVRRFPTFKWSRLGNAAVYQLHLVRQDDPSAVRDFAVPAQAEDVIVFEVPDSANPLAADRAFRWMVRGVDRLGAPGPWSSEWSFRTLASEVQSAPTLATPIDGRDNALLRPNFSWSRLGNAVRYELLIARADSPGTTRSLAAPASAGDPVLYSFSETEPDLAADRSFRWKVRGIDRFGDAGPWSTESSFKTRSVLPPPPAAPVVANISTGAIVPLDIGAVSVRPVNGAAFEVHLTRLNDNTVAFAGAGLTATPIPLPRLSAGANYRI